MTVGQIENEARILLNDTVSAAYRWKEPEVLRAVFDAVRALHAVRPESRYFGLRLATLKAPYIDDDAEYSEIEEVRGRELQIDERWRLALIHFVAHRCYEMDNPDTQNANLSARHLETFRMWSML